MLTPEDKALIAEYMGWVCDCGEYYREAFPNEQIINYDSNDAGLCVEKMNDDCGCEWENFVYHTTRNRGYEPWFSIIADIFMNSDNFFQAMAAWLRSKK